jgi:hypothetical protein
MGRPGVLQQAREVGLRRHCVGRMYHGTNLRDFEFRISNFEFPVNDTLAQGAPRAASFDSGHEIRRHDLVMKALKVDDRQIRNPKSEIRNFQYRLSW